MSFEAYVANYKWEGGIKNHDGETWSDTESHKIPVVE